ncbi:uncharacterized protein H6S33_004198 [Morchella sextelata]|uniref:uncharacterized protein n=1 Tax=Morchella sextelata TaxID=1174677 RepID=UPI001D03BF7E|nr:uncharacterized protein H6S33_004198 [Morchella sextelata]KAH0605741.1 hypothetical protein H6S33_004198 [Morchella sextelata]
MLYIAGHFSAEFSRLTVTTEGFSPPYSRPLQLATFEKRIREVKWTSNSSIYLYRLFLFVQDSETPKAPPGGPG